MIAKRMIGLLKNAKKEEIHLSLMPAETYA